MPSRLRVQAIWLTPLLTNAELGRQTRERLLRSLFIIGTDDPWYDADALRKLERVTQGASLVIRGADHSLEVPEGVSASLQVMAQVVRAVQPFLDRTP